jgi:hypothetical protein
MFRKLILAILFVYGGSVFAAGVPVANADLGSCAAHFRVTDASGRPVYGANIHVEIDRNLISLPRFFTIRGIPWRSKEIRVLTDANGEAVISGLPEKIKKQLVFDVSKARFMSLIVFAPENDSCHPDFDVKFE